VPVFFSTTNQRDQPAWALEIEDTEEFFKSNVPQHRAVTHPHKRLQHLLAGFCCNIFFELFLYELIKIADTRKPFLPDEQYHFSISHCGDYAAAIVSKDKRVGIDVEFQLKRSLRSCINFSAQRA
jgi:phosphopantetheinyl transferase